MSKIKKIIRLILYSIRISLIGLGVILLLIIVLALTSLPFWAQYRLGSKCAMVPRDTKTILVMGANGFPSETVLLRLWYTSDLAHKYPAAKVVIATPGNISDTLSTVMLMRKALIVSGVDSTRILLESDGLNTRHQALMAYSMFQKDMFQEPLVVVSSTTHIYRCVRAFEKAGFTKVSGKPTLASMLETDLRFEKNSLGGDDMVPDVGKSIVARYKFWDYLKYEVEVAREYTAIAYYKIKGWI